MTAILAKTKTYFTTMTLDKAFRLVSYVLAFLTVTCYIFQLGVAYAIDEHQVLPGTTTITISVLRWATIVTVALATLTPFFGGRKTRVLLIVFGLGVGVMNLVMLENNLLAWGKGRETMFPPDAGYAYTPERTALFVIEQIAFILLAGLSAFRFIREKEYKQFTRSDFLWFPVVLAGMVLLFINPYFFEDVKRVYNEEVHHWKTEDFSPSHLTYLSFNILLIIGGYVALRNKDENSKRYFLTALGLSSFFIFFYAHVNNKSWWNFSVIPTLHLCNLATILITLAYAFKIRPLFYFTFFVNVIGTVFAMTMPDATYYAFGYEGLRFWYNHILVFTAPILGVVLDFFPRPKLKDIGASIIVFTFYFLAAAIANAWVSNYNPTINYFFINDNFYLSKVGWTDSPLRKDPYIWTLNVNGQPWVFYPAYHLLVYFIYIVLMFLLWYLYDTLFLVGDAHKNLRIKKHLMKQGYADLKKMLNGRSLKEPLYEEAKDMIEIKDFTKIYSGSSVPSVDHLSLTIHPGEVYGFLGHNGAGKSTTIKSLVGIQSITSGQIIVNGYDVAKQPVEAKRTIGYVSDNHAVYERLTGREYINYIADLYMVPQAERDERIEKYVKMFHLEDAIDREAKSYSHGMKQKLVVIASLIHDPKVWVLDEPLTGLDPTSSYQIKEVMKEHASRGNIVFFSSHVIEVVEKICTRICIISHGKLMCEYSLDELKEKGMSLEELYLKYVSSQERIH
ncbi:MAG: YwaF family protein [Bacilli bacterium]|nr:YwaF family protein [Bacilli bacterium]